MSEFASPAALDALILAARGPKEPVDPWRPYAHLVEDERTADGRIEAVATLFLTNRECPLRCLMCDLWRHTLDASVPLGAIPAQIDFALATLPAARHLKLYNSGNFFDRQAIPLADHAAIAKRARGFRTLIVENHPRLCGDDCRRFQDLLGPDVEFEIALGLETIHPDVLPRLNKRMTVDDFARAAERLRSWDIHVRAFVLLRPPYLSEAEGIEWAVRSVEFARSSGARCVSVIPVRGGNGMMERLAAQGDFVPPSLAALEEVCARTVRADAGRLLVDLWDAEKFARCATCGPARIARLAAINLSQTLSPAITCATCGDSNVDRNG